MSFADWKKRSKLFASVLNRIGHADAINNLCRNAYRTGERDGIKQVEDAAKRAIELRELMRVKKED